MPNELGKGPQFEYMISGLFQNQGYLTRRSIPLHYGNNQDATDIDILGVLFTQPFQMHKIICDCKNKQKSKPYERIFWAKGLAQFVGANDTYVSLPQASWDTVKFAQKGDVRILTSDTINEYFLRNTNLYGMADDKFYVSFFNDFNNTIKSNKTLVLHWNTLRRLYLNEDPYVAINILMELLLTGGKQLELTKENNQKSIYAFWKYICCESLVLIGLNLLNICSDTICLSQKARELHILSKLTYGDIEPSKINNILDYAKNVANEMVKASIPKTALPKDSVVDFGQISPPPYAPGIIGLVERAIQNPEWYINLPQVLDYVLFELAVKDKEFSLDNFKLIFNSGFVEEKIKAAKNILAFSRSACKIDLKLLWDSSDSFMIKKNDSIGTDLKNINIDNSVKIDYKNEELQQLEMNKL